jgi:hypothetical protein
MSRAIPQTTLLVLALLAAPTVLADDTTTPVVKLVRQADVKGGLCVCLPVSDGRREMAIADAGPFVVHGLSRDPAVIATSRQRLEELSYCGRVTLEHTPGVKRLPHANNLVNLLVVDLDRLGDAVPGEEEIRRVLAPGGRVVLREKGRWRQVVEPRPEGMDEWTHLNHGPDGNPVSTDRHLQNLHGLRWIGSQVMGWGVFSIRSTNGRVFLFWDTCPVLRNKRGLAPSG